MMELGARVCTPRSPVCGECPVSRWCAALALERSDAAAAGNEGRRITDFPARPVKAAKKEESLAVCVLEWRAAPDSRWLLLARREDKGLLAGQWEFPCAPEDTTPQCDVESVLRRLGHGDACAVQHQQLGVVEHVFSHVKWTMQVQHRVLHRNGAPAVLQGVTDAGTPWRWLKLDADGACAQELTGGLRKVLALLKPATAKRKAR